MFAILPGFIPTDIVIIFLYQCRTWINIITVQKIEMLDNELPSISNGVGTPSKKLTAYPLAKLQKNVGMQMLRIM